MKKELKEIIDKSIKIDEENLRHLRFEHILIIDSAKRYDGFWGKNDYNNIILLGYSENKYYYINHIYQVDVLNFINELKIPYAFDIPNIYGCLRVFSSDGYFRITSLLSSIHIDLLRR